MAARLMNGRLSASIRTPIRRGSRRFATPTSLPPTVTQVTQDAERMASPHFRAQLLRMAAEDQGHVTWLRDTLLARGGALPTRVCPR